MTLLHQIPHYKAFAVIIAVVFTLSSCKKINNPEPGELGSATIKTTSDGTRNATWSYNENGIIKDITWDNQDVYGCENDGTNIITININPNNKVLFEYDADNNITKVTQDQDAIKFINTYTYVNGFLNTLTGVLSTKQSDGSYTDETVVEVKNVVADESGIQSCTYESFVGGSSFKVYDVVMTCNEDDNPLLQNAPHIGLLEYTDFFFSLFYLSEKCPTSAEYTEQGTQNSTEITCDWTLNSNGTVSQCNIDAGQQTANRSYTY